MMTDNKPSKTEEARRGLPEHLQPVFDDLVEDYKLYAQKHHRHPFFAPLVLAELVRNGWRGKFEAKG